MKGSLRTKRLFLDIHSGMWSLLVPWGGKFDFQDIPAGRVDSWQVLTNLMQAPFKDISNQVCMLLTHFKRTLLCVPTDGSYRGRDELLSGGDVCHTAGMPSRQGLQDESWRHKSDAKWLPARELQMLVSC